MMMEDLISMTRLLLTTIAIASLLAGFLIKRFTGAKRKYPPAMPGLPIVGNLLQLKEKHPYNHFREWAMKYGPIYSICIGANPVVVINSSKIAKEAMVTNYQSINTRKLPHSIRVLSGQKTMIAMSDYDQYHLMSKKLILKHLLGNTALKQKQNRILRETMLEKMVDSIHTHLNAHRGSPEGLNVKQTVIAQLFPLAMKQAFGREVESVYVEEMETSFSKWELYNIFVIDPMKGAIEVDWRDSFPYLRWVPFTRVEENLSRIERKRDAALKALIREQRQLLASGKERNCFLDIILEETQGLTEEQERILIWEPIVQTADTTLIATEWAMFELSKNPHCQDRLYEELKRVCGNETVTEDFLPNLPYLNAVFHETLRKHPPVPILPPRFVHDQDVELGGFHIPAGSEIAINIYGCHNNGKEWENPEKWNPERFVGVDEQMMDLQKTMAFGAGKRACAGAGQAYLIACSTIGRFVQQFKWELTLGEEESVDTVVLTAHKLHPLKALVTPRR